METVQTKIIEKNWFFYFTPEHFHTGSSEIRGWPWQLNRREICEITRRWSAKSLELEMSELDKMCESFSTTQFLYPEVGHSNGKDSTHQGILQNTFQGFSASIFYNVSENKFLKFSGHWFFGPQQHCTEQEFRISPLQPYPRRARKPQILVGHNCYCVQFPKFQYTRHRGITKNGNVFCYSWAGWCNIWSGDWSWFLVADLRAAAWWTCQDPRTHRIQF